jgi:hypothetical protein
MRSPNQIYHGVANGGIIRIAIAVGADGAAKTSAEKFDG